MSAKIFVDRDTLDLPRTFDTHREMTTDTIDGLLHLFRIIVGITNKMQVLDGFLGKKLAAVKPVQPIDHQFIFRFISQP